MKTAKLTLALALALPAVTTLADATPYDGAITAQKITHGINDTGFSFGFYVPDNSKLPTMTQYFGRRSLQRIDFISWSKMEPQKNHYDFGHIFNKVKSAHLNGENVVYCTNVAFTARAGGQKPSSIPRFYPQDIADPATRAAAKAYLYAFVQEALKQTGSLWLTIDYEINSNYKLNNTPAGLANAKKWSDWMVEAYATCRQAAADMGLSAQLKLLPIFNGNVTTTNHVFYIAPNENMTAWWTKNAWAKAIIDSADFVGFDTYFQAPGTAPANPKGTLDTIARYVDVVARGKPVIMCENGFTTAAETNPDAGAKVKSKYVGTEAQQAGYYANLTQALETMLLPGGKLHGKKFIGWSLWAFEDVKNKKSSEAFEYNFGIVREDMTKKPAAAPIKQFTDDIHNTPSLNPSKIVSSAGTPLANITTSFAESRVFDTIKITLPSLKPHDTYTLTAHVQNPGGLIICVNDKDWIALTAKAATSFSSDITQYLNKDRDNTIELYFTGESLPFSQTVRNIQLLCNNHQSP